MKGFTARVLNSGFSDEGPGCRRARPAKNRDRESFPRRGRIFSIVRKTGGKFFHSVEKSALFFPQCGKKFSTVWKNPRLAGLAVF